MGNKKSTPKQNQEGNTPGQSSAHTKYSPNHAANAREGKQGKKKKERPLSDPSLMSIGDDVTGPNFNQFYLKPSEDIGGKRITGMSLQFPLPLADYDMPSSEQLATGAQIELFKTALAEVLKIWPEYFPVKQISVHDSSSDLITTLEQVANRLCQQHNSIKRLSEEYHELKQIFDELREESDALKQMLHRRDEEIDRLKQDCGLLMGELKRRGLDYKLPTRTSTSNADYDPDALSPRSDMSNYSSLGREEESGIGVNRKGSKLYAPTPLIMAEGGRSRSFLEKRVKNIDLSHSMQDKWVWPESNAPDDLKEKVRWLQAALENEREKHGNKERNSSSPTSQKRFSTDTIIQQYTKLQHEAFDKLRRQVMNNLVHISEDRQLSFISSIVVESYNSAQATTQQFQDTIIGLMLEPTKPIASQRNSMHNKANRTGSIMDNVRKFEFEQKRAMMKQEHKRFSSSEVPDRLMNQIFDFLESCSDSTSISTLTENTIDGLRKDYADCLIPSLLNHSTFTNFLHSVCRLTWKISLPMPPLYITTEISKFESRYHVTNSGNPTPGETIRFYQWPILLSKKHGEVLSKGIVKL